MKKLLALAVIAGGVLFVIKRNKGAKAAADWREVTTSAGKAYGSASANGSAPVKAAEVGRNN